MNQIGERVGKIPSMMREQQQLTIFFTQLPRDIEAKVTTKSRLGFAQHCTQTLFALYEALEVDAQQKGCSIPRITREDVETYVTRFAEARSERGVSTPSTAQLHRFWTSDAWQEELERVELDLKREGGTVLEALEEQLSDSYYIGNEQRTLHARKISLTLIGLIRSKMISQGAS